ncbi:MAG: Hcp family type VI secretion system effector [Limisphaerales bacterium]
MAVDIFLKLDTIKAEAQDKKHKDEIDVLSFSWGMTNSGTAHAGGGGGAGKVNVQDMTVSKYVDASSPALMLACCNGQHFSSALLTVRKAGKTPLEYLKITMTQVLITSVSGAGASNDDRLKENITLNFAKVQVDYTPQKNDGTAGTDQTMNFNIAENASD